MLRICEEKIYFQGKKIRFVTALDEIKFLKQIRASNLRTYFLVTILYKYHGLIKPYQNK